MKYRLSNQSRGRLAGVHPDLQRVVMRAIEISDQDFMVLEGVRTPERQRELYGQGRTAQQLKVAGVDPKLAKPGLNKVTWTLKSNHFVQAATGKGHAVDLVPFPVDWNDLKKFDAMADAMKRAAKEVGVTIRWGADWDADGKPREKGESDSPHFELVR